MKRQTDLRLIGYITKYGCFFMCLVYYYMLWLKKVDLEHRELNRMWDEALAKGIITEDINGDGDLDDAGECLITDKERLLTLAGIRAKYSQEASDYKIKNGEYAIAEMFNRRTGFIHFVVIDENRKIIYDPILNSVTTREGVIKSIRILRSVK